MLALLGRAPSVACKFDFFTYKSLARCEAFVLIKSIGFEIDYASVVGAI